MCWVPTVLCAHCVLSAHCVLGAHCLLALVSYRRYKENKSNSDCGDIPAVFFSNIRRFKIWLSLQVSPVEPFLVHEKCLCPGPSRGEGRWTLRLGILVMVWTTSQRGQEGVPGHRCPGEEAPPFHLLCLCRSAGLSSVNPFEQTHLCPALANDLSLCPIPLQFVNRLYFEGWRLAVVPRHALSQRRVERKGALCQG